MEEKEELQKKIIAYRVLESKLNSFVKQRDILLSKLVEIQNTLTSIEEIKKRKDEILFPLGSETFMRGRIVSKNKIIVGIGANIALEKSIEDAKKILEKRKLEIETNLNEIQKSILNISSQLEKLGPEITKLAERLK